jgi:hypothetical protein
LTENHSQQRNATLLRNAILFKKGLTENLLKKGLIENPNSGVIKRRNACALESLSWDRFFRLFPYFS